ncbi:MAG: inositol monophosphatase [Spirochaetia bacterium]|nr:inositol monophosphatase [Spirochaetia bacterium]
MKDLLNTAIDAAKEAGDFLYENFGKHASIESKSEKNLVTNLDKEAEEMIIRKITAAFPGHSLLGEESGESSTDSDYMWIIDPLDGTHNFIRGIDVYGVSIGITYKQQFAGGVIYMPVSNEMYSAEKGSGSFKNGKKISVSSITDVSKCSLSYDSTIRENPEMILGILKHLSKEVFNIRMTGSSVRLLSYIAEGIFDISVEFCDSAWDFAAGAVLIQEAGGVITALDGSPLRYKSRGYLAANPEIHPRIRDILTPYLAVK